MPRLLLVVMVITQFSFLAFLIPTPVLAAVTTIDNDANQSATAHLFSGSQTVFISDQVGYKFYRDQPSAGRCVYSKTVNGGDNWGAAVTVDAQTDCIGIVVWYDRWTPEDTGTFIHIATMENASTFDQLFYNRLDTTTDTLLMGTTPVAATTNYGSVATYALGTNQHTISKSTTGEIFIAASDASDSFVVRCSSSCNSSANWSAAGTSPLSLTNDWNILMPQLEGNMLLINRAVVPNVIQSSLWNGSNWTSWSTIDAAAIENNTYDVGMAATIDHGTGDVFLAYGADHNNFTVADHDLRTAKYSGGSWTRTTDIFTDIPDRGLHQVAISLDINTNTVYVAYSIRSAIATAASADIHFATSTAAMSSWSSEQGPVNSTSANIYGVDLNIMSDERIFVSWFDVGARDILGDTIADIAPITKVSRLGTPIATVTGDSSNVLHGGMFVVQENLSSRNVTNINISERGTIAANEHLANIKLFYDLDTTAPYDCVSESYSGTESQFGSTASGGFSGANGTVTFSDTVAISTTTALCLYPVYDVLDTALDGDTIRLSIENPVTDVIVSGGVESSPAAPVRFVNSTTVLNDELTQFGYHWRNDNGTEVSATSATAGNENTPITALAQNAPVRLRVGISNEGTQTSPATNYRLEYSTAAPTCSEASIWTDVGAVADDWDMYDSPSLTDGTNTTDISAGNGGLTNPPTKSFLTTNGGVRDTTSETGALTLTGSQFVELEYAIIPTASSTEGTTYCFRVTDAGEPLFAYNTYPQVTVSADVTVAALGNQVSSLLIPSTAEYLGGTFMIRENVSSRTVQNITLAETGTVTAASGVSAIRLYYDYDTTAPYDCSSESYSGSEPQFGTDATFVSANGTTTITGTMNISTTQTACVYAVVDVSASANSGETIAISLPQGGNSVTLSAGSSAPTTPIEFASSTTLLGAELEQFGFHWRADDNDETAASSLSAGSENTTVVDYVLETPIRLRVGVENSGAATALSQAYTLQYAPKITTCAAIGTWQNVGASGDGFLMYDSPFLTNADDTSDIAIGLGGLSNPSSKTFLSPNAGVSETSATSTTTSLSTTDFLELEYSIVSSDTVANETPYCFRLIANGRPLSAYLHYPELVTAPKRDFFVQQGQTAVSGSDVTLLAGVDYLAPTASSSAFVRITNSHHTGAGRTAAGGGSQNNDDVTAYITNATDLTTSFTISRPPAAIADTYVTWEIIDFVGEPGTDNEMLIRDVGTASFGSSDVTSNGSVTTVTDDTKVVVYITGVENRNTGRNAYYAGQVTAEWDSVNSRPVFTRGNAGASLVNVSYAVVEYTGINWNIQRIEHTYTAGGVVETASITPVGSLARTFLHTQKRMGAQGNVDNFGHEIWLSSIGAVSLQLEATASTPSDHTSVVWVIENMQTSQGRMRVQRVNGTTNGGTEPVTLSVSIPLNLKSTANASIMTTTRAAGSNTAFPRPIAGSSITSTSTFELWRSEATSLMTYRTEIIEWPVHGLAVRQNYYRMYADNDALLPTDPWPPGPLNVGENTPLTANDAPLGQGDRIRIRMSTQVSNANLPFGLYDFSLQYALRVTTCTAATNWIEVGAANSGSIWRYYDAPSVTDGTALSGNPPTGGDLLLSVSDVSGTYNESSPSPTNPFLATPGQDVEFDWHIEQNGANQRSTYCFRMVQGSGEQLDGYIHYPQIRTAGFTPVIKHWRWYTDDTNETPTLPAAAESVAPVEIQHNETLALRVTLGEAKSITGTDIKFGLQYDESPLFTNPRTVVSSSSCQTQSIWCYADGAVLDNQPIEAAVISTSASCIAGVGDGCGVHNTSALYQSGDTHSAGVDREYAFYIRQASARVGAVYYFRMVELSQSENVFPADTYSYPTVVAASAGLSFAINGLPAGTTTADITTTATTTSDAIQFGSLQPGVPKFAAHRLTIDTNATEGYRVYTYARTPLQNTYQTPIPNVLGTNSEPLSWSLGCMASTTGCVGYHTTDATLSGTTTRFAAHDTYAGLHQYPAEVAFSPILADESHDIVYKIEIRPDQPAGDYETEIVYIAMPVY